MIYHQSPYGHIIKMPTELYYSLSDSELEQIEQRYINVDIHVVSYCGPEQTEIDEIIDNKPKGTNFDFYTED